MEKLWSECDLKDYLWLSADVKFLERALDVAKRAQLRIRSQYNSEPEDFVVYESISGEEMPKVYADLKKKPLTEKQTVINTGRY